MEEKNKKIGPSCENNWDCQGLIDSFPFFIMLIDSTHHIVRVNKAVEQTLKMKSGDIVGSYCPKLIHGLASPFPGCPLEEAVENAKDSVVREFFDQESGSWMSSSVYLTAYRTADGKAIFVHIVRDITELKKAEETVRKNSDIQSVLNALLEMQMNNPPLEEILIFALDRLLSIPWLSLESKGAIFLSVPGSGKLTMKVQRNLAPQIIAACSEVEFGRCICGRAAASKELEFADRLDERHDVRYEGITDHGQPQKAE